MPPLTIADPSPLAATTASRSRCWPYPARSHYSLCPGYAEPHPTAWEPAAQVSEKKKLRLDTRLPAAFWLYAAFSATTMLGFSTWAVLAYHLTSRHLISASLVPVLYALAMAAASTAAAGFGRIYDRVGLRGLLALPPLAAVVPLLSFSMNTGLLIAGTALWGAGMGILDSTPRDLRCQRRESAVPSTRQMSAIDLGGRQLLTRSSLALRCRR